MRKTIAKKLRNKARKIAAKIPTRWVRTGDGIICTGFRLVYQQLKAAYLLGKSK